MVRFKDGHGLSKIAANLPIFTQFLLVSRKLLKTHRNPFVLQNQDLQEVCVHELNMTVSYLFPI